MLSYLLNYKNIPPDKRPVFFNQHASDAPTRKSLNCHVGAADGLRNGGSRTKSQPDISFEENPVIGLSRGVTITSYVEIPPPPTTFA